MVCWMDEGVPMRVGGELRDQAHDAFGPRGWCNFVQYRLDINSLHRDEDAERNCRSMRSAASTSAPPPFRWMADELQP